MRIGFTKHPSAGICLLIDKAPSSRVELDTTYFYKESPYAEGRNTKQALKGETPGDWAVLVPLEWS